MRAVTRFGDTVSAAGEPEDLLPTVLMTVMNAVHAPGASVVASDGRLIALHGLDIEGESLPLRVSGRDVGTLQVAARGPAESYTDGTVGCWLRWPLRWRSWCARWSWPRPSSPSGTASSPRRGSERDRLRRDLHDGLGPSLSGVSLGLQALDTALEVGDEPTACELLDRVRAEAGTAVGEVRRILEDLRPAALDDAGLADAMRRHADAVSPGVPVEVDCSRRRLPPLPPSVETAAYRIAQEALTNAVRHADASQRPACSRRPRGSAPRRGHRRRPGVRRRRSRRASAWARCSTAPKPSAAASRSRPGDHGTTVVALLPLESPA